MESLVFPSPICTAILTIPHLSALPRPLNANTESFGWALLSKIAINLSAPGGARCPSPICTIFVAVCFLTTISESATSLYVLLGPWKEYIMHRHEISLLDAIRYMTIFPSPRILDKLMAIHPHRILIYSHTNAIFTHHTPMEGYTAQGSQMSSWVLRLHLDEIENFLPISTCALQRCFR
jgi:hypothetical protein